MRSPRRLAPVLAAAVLAAPGCGGGGDEPEALDRASACRAVSDHLDVAAFEERFGEADAKQDFFGDTVITYRRDDGDWKFQVSGKVGAFRALRQVKGRPEEILPCRQ
ncbi:MAG TPA: hypothetical protein VF520_15655 [Thermoleophilaceae bacterium]